MNVLKKQITLTTDAAGDAEGFLGPFTGQIDSIVYQKDDYATGVDFAIVSEDLATPIWSENNVDASTRRTPRQAAHSVAGVALTYDATQPVPAPIYLSSERVKITVSNGGNATSGTFIVQVLGGDA